MTCHALADRLACAQAALEVARAVGLPYARCHAAAHCASELASNAVRHAGGGELVVRALVDGPRPVLEIECLDHGPGIDDPARAREDGWSRGRALTPDEPRRSGLGTGLGAVHRFAQSVVVEPGPNGVGTRIVVRLW